MMRAILWRLVLIPTVVAYYAVVAIGLLIIQSLLSVVMLVCLVLNPSWASWLHTATDALWERWLKPPTALCEKLQRYFSVV